MSAAEETRTINSGPREWDAETYDAVSDPQCEWGTEVLARLQLSGAETVLDAGCGSGRVTAKLAELLPNGRLVAVDGSEAMIAKAKERLRDRAEYLVADLSELTLDEPVDLIFSTATFHWIADHAGLFGRLHAALRPGGKLVAQCGGEGNVANFASAIALAMARPEFASRFEGIEGMWNFAAPEETERHLRNSGFADVRCWLEPKLVVPERPYEYVYTVTLGPHLARLPERLRRPFAEAVLAEAGTPLKLDYVRLNIEATA